MPTIFYDQRYTRPFPISFLFIEHVANTLRSLPKEQHNDPAVITRQVLAALTEVCKLENPGQEALDYALQRLSDIVKEAQDTTDGKPKPSKKVGFATSYMDWASALEPQDVCLLAAEFDYQRATYLYCEVDRDDVLKITEARMRCDWERIKIAYESSVYAFGGSYDGDDSASKGKVTEYDLSGNDAEGLAALSKVL